MSKRVAPKDRSHLLLHAALITFTLLAIYPVLWVFSVAFSGTQNLAFSDVPPDPGGSCVQPACSGGRVTTAPRPGGTPCNDERFCTATDRCDGAGNCRAL